MPSKTYNSNHLRRLSWPTLINPNVLLCKSRTMNFSNDNYAAVKTNRLKEIHLVKLNSKRHNSVKTNSTIVDNLFRSIRKRKLKHPINCFNRKNVKLQLLFSCSSNYDPQDYPFLDLSRSKEATNSNHLTQSAMNLTELEEQFNLNKDDRTVNQYLKRSRSSIEDFEYLDMEWLKAIRNSVDSSSNRRKDDDLQITSNKSFNNLIKLEDLRNFKQQMVGKEWKQNRDTFESLEQTGVRLFGYVDPAQLPRKSDKQSTKKDLIAKDLKDFKQQQNLHADLRNDKLIENRIEELFNSSLKDEHKSEDFNSTNLNASEQFNLEGLIDEAFSFPVGKWEKSDCEICFQECWLHRRVCCDYAVCSSCLSQYFQERVSLGSFSIECINNRCHAPVNRNEISISLEPKFKEIYHNLLRVNNDLGKLIRTCPNCNFLHKLKDNFELKKMRKHRKKDPTVSRVKCEECETNWCFLCHAPWHSNITCKQFIAGDRLLRDWAKQFNGGQVNAQKCPTCKAFIQRISGCDHMHCSNCDTDFCYKCGEKLRRLKFFGNHYSKLSVFGCKYRYKANQPALRKTVRFTVFCAKLAAAPVCCSALIAALGVAVGVGAAALPVYGLLRATRWVVEQRSNKRNQLKKNTLRPISKQDIDSAISHSNSSSSKFDVDLSNPHLLHFTTINDGSSLHTATFSQNHNWIANYGLMGDLNSTTTTSTNLDNFSTFSAFSGFNNLNDLNSLSTSNDEKTLKTVKHRQKARKSQLIFQQVY